MAAAPNDGADPSNAAAFCSNAAIASATRPSAPAAPVFNCARSARTLPVRSTGIHRLANPRPSWYCCARSAADVVTRGSIFTSNFCAQRLPCDFQLHRVNSGQHRRTPGSRGVSCTIAEIGYSCCTEPGVGMRKSQINRCIPPLAAKKFAADESSTAARSILSQFLHGHVRFVVARKTSHHFSAAINNLQRHWPGRIRLQVVIE